MAGTDEGLTLAGAPPEGCEAAAAAGCSACCGTAQAVSKMALRRQLGMDKRRVDACIAIALG